MLTAILIGMISNFGYDLVKQLFFSETPDLIRNIRIAFYEAELIFHKKYGDKYGALGEDSFPEQKNFDEIQKCFLEGNNFLQTKDISLKHYDNFPMPEKEVINDFINIFQTQAMKNDALSTRISLMKILNKLEDIGNKNESERKLTIEEIKRNHSIQQAEGIQDYMPRTVLQYSEAISNESSFLRYINSKNITEIIEQENRIVLLADAGLGKSTEIQKLLSNYADKDSRYYPLLVKLSLYTTDKIEELLPHYWKEIPEKSLLLMMDGFDEIIAENRSTAIREIEKFSEKHLNCKIIVTCRTNFYNSASDNYSGTLKSFNIFVLNKLTWEDSSKYIDQKIGIEKNLFYEIVNKNKSNDSLDIPFYLKFLVKEYLVTHSLPNSRQEIFIMLIERSIESDEEHIRTKSRIDNFERKKTVFIALERLAVTMEILCRNYISNEEYFEIVTDSHTRSILKETGLWENKGDRWQFQNNTFQEFLAAKVLSSVPIEILKNIISFHPYYRVIIPSWVNTLSFLLGNYKNDDLKNWILRIQPELLIKCEPDRINITLRKKIFRSIFNNYKEKRIWIERDKYNYFELAKFGESNDTINFLLEHLISNGHFVIIANAIHLLIHMNIPFEFNDQIRQLLLHIAFNNKKVETQNDAIIALGILGLINRETIDKLFQVFGKSDNDWIRYAMYFILENSSFLDEFIEYFLEGIKFYSEQFSNGQRDSRIGNEFMHLENGLKKIKQTNTVIKILDYFLINPSVYHTIGFDKTIPQIFENIAEIYLKTHDEIIFQKVLDIYSSTNDYFINEFDSCLIFFEKTQTKARAFNNYYTYKNKNNTYVFFHRLARISDKNSSKLIINDYAEGKLEENEIWHYQKHLTKDLYDVFNKGINEVSNNKFIDTPGRDFNKEHDESIKKDIELLFDKEYFLKETQSIFENEQTEIISDELLKDIRYGRYEEPNKYPNVVTAFLKNQFDEHERKIDIVINTIKNMHWEEYLAHEIYNFLSNHNEIKLNILQRNILEDWCIQNLKSIDFKTALKVEGKSFKASRLSIMLVYFLKEYKFNYPKEVLLDMLSFDFLEGSINYLEEFLTQEEMIARILSNFQFKKLNERELRNYLKYCTKYKISSSQEYAEKTVLNVEMDSEIRKLALDLINSLKISSNKLLKMARKLEDGFKWEIVDLLVKRKHKATKDYLMLVLNNAPFEDKIHAADYLMWMQNLDGLKFYTELLVKEKQFPNNWHRQRSISTIKSTKALPYLLRLLKLSYDKELVEDKFDSLYRQIESIMTNIAMTNERNLKIIRNAVTHFIEENKNEIGDVYFLNAYLERLERQFYFSKSQNITLSDAFKKLELIGI